MEESKGQNIFLIVISIITLLVAIIGATFAWFSIKLSDVGETKEKIITKATLGAVVFENDYNITLEDLTNNKIIKKFKIYQTDRSSNDLIKYNIKLNIISNNLNDGENIILTNKLIGKGTSNGGSLASIKDNNVPNKSIILGSGTIVGYEEHEYEYELNVDNTNLDLLTDKKFNAYLSVELIENK